MPYNRHERLFRKRTQHSRDKKKLVVMVRGEQNYLIILSPIIEKIPHY